MKENNEKKIINCDEISKLIKAFPKDIAALDKRFEGKIIIRNASHMKVINLLSTDCFSYDQLLDEELMTCCLKNYILYY